MRLLRTVRSSRLHPASTAVAVASIALTTGMAGVTFTAVKSVLIEPMPYARPGELLVLRSEGKIANWVSWPDMQDLRRQAHMLASVAPYHYYLLDLPGDAQRLPEALYGLAVSADLFPTLGVKPMFGRNILPEEDRPGSNHVMILSYGLWRRRFQSDPNALGRTIFANGLDYRIIGVMPPGFDFPLRLATTVRTPSRYMEFWTALGQDPAQASRADAGFGAVARMRPGVTLGQARQDLAAVARSLEHDYPQTNRGRVIDAMGFEEQTLGSSRDALLVLMAAAGLFLAIGCANVANLLLARWTGKRREIAVRVALGASRGQIVREMLAESLLLAASGGLGGFVLTAAAWSILPAIAPQNIPRLADAHADWGVFAFTLAVAALNGVLFGVVPALRSASSDPAEAMREAGGRGLLGAARGRLRRALVACEIAVTVLVVALGSALASNFARLMHTDLGFKPEGLVAAIVVPLGEPYKQPDARQRIWERILETARRMPGVESAGAVDALPFSGENYGAEIRTPADEVRNPSERRFAESDHVTSEYLQTMGLRLLEGRWFRRDEETNGADVAIIDAAAANRFFPGKSALGQRICIGCAEGRKPVWKQVVGVVNTARHASIEGKTDGAFYQAAGALRSAQFLVVRTRASAAETVAEVRRRIAAIDANVPVYLGAGMSALIGDSVADRRFTMSMLAAMGVLALVLAAAGVFAVVSYVASERRREIGVRMALGANPASVYRLVLRNGMTPAIAGIVVGLAISPAALQGLRGVMVGIDGVQPLPIAAAAVLAALIAIAACTAPAWRAMKLDPTRALQEE